jgi:uncharacterized protein (TIGR02145 family)/uncharacterized repeat protein (TIGR02543 family)
MKKRIILLLAALMALLQCSDSGFEYDNPWDPKAGNYNQGSFTLTTYATTGGSVSSPGEGTYHYYEEKSVTVTATAESGYRFTNWSGASESVNPSINITMDGNKTLTANFQLENVTTPTYRVTFDANGGTVNPTSGTTGENGTLADLPTPTRSDYTFKGWWTTAEGGDSVTVDWVYNADATVYARWTLNTFTITFDANGGTVSPTSDTTGEGYKLALLPTPKRICYTFNGWYTSAVGGETVTANTVFSSDVTVYALWTNISSCTTFTDSRDGKMYKKVTIGTQVWMAENLNFDVPNVTSDVCKDNSAENCAKYGRLYNWSTAMGIDPKYNSTYLDGSDVKHQGVCPAGWHLPSHDEWSTLMDTVGGSSIAGRKLKAQSGWYNCGPEGSSSSYVCEDAYGFAALPGGYGLDGSFSPAAYYGYWWSATETGTGTGARRGGMNYGSEDVNWDGHYKRYLYSVRCAQD